jgi:glycosyltransferase involved in cell wall biosynthesis
MLSILIPTYNYNVTLLVESLIKQLKTSAFPFELRIQDDCSTKSEAVKANQALENYTNCHFQQNFKNIGRTATRQALAEAAKYNWLLFMDADVLPKNEDFIKKFDLENQTADVVFGGIGYETKKPEKEKMLRWKYGKAREAKPVSEREKMAYLSIISQCFLIKKEVFLKANDFHDNVYGVDVLFCQNLEKMQVQVAHIDNPIVHLGLESSTSFIDKTKKGLESLHQFEKENKIPKDYRPIQKAYQTLNNKGALKLFMKIMKTFEKAILKNLKSSSPSLFLFDLFRLNYFSSLQSKPQTLNIEL